MRARSRSGLLQGAVYRHSEPAKHCDEWVPNDVALRRLERLALSLSLEVAKVALLENASPGAVKGARTLHARRCIVWPSLISYCNAKPVQLEANEAEHATHTHAKTRLRLSSTLSRSALALCPLASRATRRLT